MWNKKLVISFCNFFILFAVSSTLASPASERISSVSGNTRPVNKQAGVLAQMLKSESSLTTFPLIALEEIAPVMTQAMEIRDSLPTQIGVNRAVGPLSTDTETGQKLNWQTLPGNGKYAGIQINSPKALALRIGMTIKSLPETAELRFFTENDGSAVTVRTVSAREILNLLQKNRDADPDNSDGMIFWSPTMSGDTLGVEIYLPKEEDPASVQVAFPLISHITSLPFSSATLQNSIQSYGDSNSCQNDASCYPTWLNLRKSVAGMQFTTSEGTYVCTGSLLNDIDPDTWEPYFLTANHCISTPAVASSLETHWYYESAFCNGPTLSSSYTRITGGATLLHTQGMDSGDPTNSSMDVTLLHLNNAAPAGAYFAGWSIAPPLGYGSLRTGIHHPHADWKKISFGTSGSDMACGWFSGDSFDCHNESGNFYSVNWFDGGTEGGSSGSALYSDKEHIIGTLTGSNGECEGSVSAYSSFRAAYTAGKYEQWLNTLPPPPPNILAPAYFLLLK